MMIQWNRAHPVYTTPSFLSPRAKTKAYAVIFLFNLLSPNINVHVVVTVLHIFVKVLIR